MTKRIVFGVVGLALAAVVILRIIQASIDVDPAPDVATIRQRSGVPVEIVAVRTDTLVLRREYTGTLRGIRSATIRARTGDEIINIPVRVGQRVGEGEVLVQQSSDGSMASVRQAEAAWQQAQRNVERLRPLREQGAISEQDWDNAMTALTVAEANLEAARRAVELTSPITGIVTDILETRGTVPSAGDPLVRVSDLSSLQVLLQVSAGQAAELSLGQTAYIPSIALKGRVSRIALQADPDSRLLEVELTFANVQQVNPTLVQEGVVPGTLVAVEVEVGRTDSALLIPRLAARDNRVWVIDSAGLAHERKVTLGLIGETEVEVTDGLREGERVVVAGASLLTEGAQTRVVEGSPS